MFKSLCWNLAGFALAMFVALPPLAHAADFYTENLRIPMAAAGPRGLEAFLMRPQAAGKYPLALISHGTPRDYDDRADMTAESYRGLAIEFAKRGFAALVVLRRGYGTSPGGKIDSFGTCGNPDYRSALAVSVADLQAAIAAMKGRSDVATDGMIAIGHSAGGLATVGLTAQAPAGLAAAINFAGGRGSSRAGMVCGNQVLVDTFRQMGTTSRTPMLWVYAKNDSFFGPALAHRFRDAFVSGGGRVAFIDAPAFGSDGHFLFSVDSASTWTPYVDNFLRAQNLPARATATTSTSPAHCRRRRNSAKVARPNSCNTRATRRTRLLRWRPMERLAGAQNGRQRRTQRATRWKPVRNIPKLAVSMRSTMRSRVE
jgi:dienelactone hydrolase